MQASVPAESLRPALPVKRERRNSASSQHSTNSNLSQASRSSRQKRARPGAVSAEALSSVPQDLKTCSAPVSTPPTQSQDKSSSLPSNRYPVSI